MNPSIQKYLNHFFSAKLNLPLSSLRLRSVGGGSINDTYQVVVDDRTKFFLKVNSATKYPGLFQKEKHGLEFLDKQKQLRVPAVIACDEIDAHQILLLQWIDGGLRTEPLWKKFGEQLASLHHVTRLSFGFEENNYMGALPQLNDDCNNWIDFFVRCRLQPQIELARINGLVQTKHVTAFENLFPQLGSIFNDEQPSLLHGDLWSGNFMCDQNSEPVLIDPAVYFGHRSIDLAMTTLFGGFEKPFYDSYNYHFPLPKNYQEQWEICNLYPILIHLNLFGAGYLSHVESILWKFQ
jgi:protein-ribulosamine 3-kinase